AELCDALGLGPIDLVGNDSGGGIAQIFAARHPERLRTLTLTNCDTHDNWPPEAVKPIVEAARSGALTEAARLMLADPGLARWAHWLRDTIPGVTRLIEVPEAKLFFPEDRPEALTGPLRELWTDQTQRREP